MDLQTVLASNRLIFDVSSHDHQVTVEYKHDGGACRPLRVHTIVISAQHDANVTLEKVRSDLMEHVIRAVIPESLMDDRTKYHLNPAGRFVVGGPHGDAGLTGEPPPRYPY